MSALERLLAQRHQTLFEHLELKGVSAVLVCSSSLAWWLTGRRDQNSVLALADGTLTADPSSSLIELLAAPSLALVGNPSALDAVALRRSDIGRLLDGSDAFRAARRRKDPFEVEMLTRAAAATMSAFEQAAWYLDCSETRFIAEMGLAFLGVGGGDAWAYDPSVASGTAAAKFWSSPDPRVAMQDEPFSVIDAAAMVRDYKADCTVTVVRAASRQFEDNVRALGEVTHVICTAIDSGVRGCAELAGVADRALRKRDLPRLPHALGHGLGLALHEHPYLSRGSSHQLAPGDVFTLEPGFYEQGIGGGRLESTYRINEQGELVCLIDAVRLNEQLEKRKGRHEV